MYWVWLSASAHAFGKGELDDYLDRVVDYDALGFRLLRIMRGWLWSAGGDAGVSVARAEVGGDGDGACFGDLHYWGRRDVRWHVPKAEPLGSEHALNEPEEGDQCEAEAG